MAIARPSIMILCAIVVLIATAAASPALSVNYPLNLQMPPVAKVGEAYSFQFASTTFQPDSDKLQYSLLGNPQWLHINSNDRTLWGTPTSDDVGTASFTISAAGEAGALATLISELPVRVATDVPKIVGNVTEQLSHSGQLSGPTDLALYCTQPFDIKFDTSIFQAKSDLTYYATLSDHTPLPSWISFDAKTLYFSGTTPSFPVPQPFEILLIASDTPGVSATSISFTLTVSNHQLIFNPLLQSIDMSKTKQVKITGIKSSLFLDKKTPRDDEIQSASAQLPWWLWFDNKSFEITGNVPSGVMSQDITITVQDIYGDSAQKSIHLVFISHLFTTAIEQLNIAVGQFFNYTIPRSILLQTNETVSLALGHLGEWLKFDPATLNIHGTIPESVSPHDTDLNLTATSSDGSLTDTQILHVKVSASAGTNSGSQDTSRAMSGRKKAGIIVGSIFSALVIAILALFFILLCRHKKRKEYASPKGSKSPRKIDISRPIPIKDGWSSPNGDHISTHDMTRDTTHYDDLEKGDDERMPEHPPKLNLNLSLKKTESNSSFSSISEVEHNIIADFNCQLGLQDEAGPSHRPHESMKIPTEMARRSSPKSLLEHKQRKKKIYRDSSFRFSGDFSVNSRLERKHPHYSSSRNEVEFSPRRRSMGSSSFASNTMSAVSTVPSAHPQSPMARHTTQLTTPLEKRLSIRPVPASPARETLQEEEHLYEEKRLNYYRRKRQSNQSPFFGPATAREPSTNHHDSPHANETSGHNDWAAKSPGSIKSQDYVHEKSPLIDFPSTPSGRKPSAPHICTCTSPLSENERFPGSLRKTRAAFARRHTETPDSKSSPSADEPYIRHVTTRDLHFTPSRRERTRESLRAAEIKSTLNDQLKTQLFTEEELSASEYEDEEDAIEDAERRKIIKEMECRPLSLRLNKNKSSSRGNVKEREKQRTKEWRPTSPQITPFYMALEHGGKENQGSTYSLNYNVTRPTASGASTSDSNESLSRPKTSTGIRPHAHTSVRPVTRRSSVRNSPGRPLSCELSFQQHLSQTQSQQPFKLSSPRKSRHHSRTQSSAFPHFSTCSSTTPKSDEFTVITAAPYPYTSIFDPNIKQRTSKPLSKASSSVYSRDSNDMRAPNANYRELAVSPSPLQLEFLAASPTSPYHDSDTKHDTSPALPSSAKSMTPYQTDTIGLGLILGALNDADTEAGADDTYSDKRPLTRIRVSSHKSPERTPLATLEQRNSNIGVSSVIRTPDGSHVRVSKVRGKKPASNAGNSDGGFELQERGHGYGFGLETGRWDAGIAGLDLRLKGEREKGSEWGEGDNMFL